MCKVEIMEQSFWEEGFQWEKTCCDVIVIARLCMNLVRAAQTVLSSTELCTLLFWQVSSKCFKMFLVCHARKGYCDSKAWKKGGGGAGFDMREANISCCRNDHCALFEKQQVNAFCNRRFHKWLKLGYILFPSNMQKLAYHTLGHARKGRKITQSLQTQERNLNAKIGWGGPSLHSPELLIRHRLIFELPALFFSWESNGMS